MRRFAIALLMIGIACARREQPVPQTQRPAPPSPPARPSVRSWSAFILTRGGLAGTGKGFMAISSDETPQTRCSAVKLSQPKRAEIESAIADAHPEKWQAHYKPQTEGMTDQFYYSFNLKLERSDGTSGNYPVSWQDESTKALPKDLRRVYDALWAARDECPQ